MACRAPRQPLVNSMCCILGIETSRDLCSAAVLSNGAAREHTRQMARAHNQHILELVDRVMDAAGLAAADLDAVAFGCGPGSFTGIRIAAAVAQAVAFGADARILPVSSTLALARAALEDGRPLRDGVFASIRSRRDACYLAGFALTDGELRMYRGDCLVTADPGWPEIQGGWTFVGDRPGWLGPDTTCYTDIPVGAGLIARWGGEAFAQGRSLAPELGLPVYVSGDSPWRPSAAHANTRPERPHAASEDTSPYPGPPSRE